MISAGCIIIAVPIAINANNADRMRDAQERAQNRSGLRAKLDLMKANITNAKDVKQMQARLASQVAYQLATAEYERNKNARAQVTLGNPVSR